MMPWNVDVPQIQHIQGEVKISAGGQLKGVNRSIGLSFSSQSACTEGT